ncbi:hypothetical protein NGB36_04240 [Streptomyces sp. RB6PN25]|uniref:rRNA methyltransferase n=1 Tax=Streptomyces humicola TaxID=2953240 RepID=A0ABT1PTE5_9ACTN|nr:hypothetical protein [Streptomyces humicola]MCQ4079820.1 hypothetical protein [Streptomyces humicola]
MTYSCRRTAGRGRLLREPNDPLAPAYGRLLTDDELLDVGRHLRREIDTTASYTQRAAAVLGSVPRPARTGMVARVWDDDRAAVAALLDGLGELPRQLAPPLVVDLFRGPGTVGFHLGRRLGGTVFAAEPDTVVHEVTSHQLAQAGARVSLHNIGCRELPQILAPRGPRDVYLVEPPWRGPEPGRDIDLRRTEPPIQVIVRDIGRARHGRPYILVLKTHERISVESAERALGGARHLRSYVPPPLREGGLPRAFYGLFAMPG